jgi:hypothetical protein
MVLDVTKQSYRGVLCMSCRQPIPLPAIVIRMEVMPQSPDSEQPIEAEHRVFSLRCRSCGREKPYRSSDIVELEGLPRPAYLGIRTTTSARIRPDRALRATNR